HDRNRGRGDRGGIVLGQPVADGGQGYAQGNEQRGDGGGQRRIAQVPERVAHRRAARALTGAGIVVAPAQALFRIQAQQPQQQQDAGHESAAFGAETGRVLGVNGGGEGAETQQRKSAEFAQNMHDHEQHTAEQGGLQL